MKSPLSRLVFRSVKPRISSLFSFFVRKVVLFFHEGCSVLDTYIFSYNFESYSRCWFHTNEVNSKSGMTNVGYVIRAFSFDHKLNVIFINPRAELFMPSAIRWDENTQISFTFCNRKTLKNFEQTQFKKWI